MSRPPLPASKLFKLVTLVGGSVLMVGVVLATALPFVVAFLVGLRLSTTEVGAVALGFLHWAKTAGRVLEIAGAAIALVGGILWGLSVYFRVT